MTKMSLIASEAFISDALVKDKKPTNKIYTPDMFGPIGTEDDSATLNLASEKAFEDDAILDLQSYTYNIKSTVTFNCCLEGIHATIIADGITTVAVQIGSATDYITTNGQSFKVPMVINKIPAGTPTSNMWELGATGIKLSNLYGCDVHIMGSNYFAVGVWLHAANDKGNVYNEYKINSLWSNKVNLLLQTEDDAWVNDNNIFANHLAFTSDNKVNGVPIVGTRQIKLYSDSGSSINNNTFYKPSIEGDAFEYSIELTNARYNTFITPRWEGTPKILFNTPLNRPDLFSYYNVFFYGWGSQVLEVVDIGANSASHTVIYNAYSINSQAGASGVGNFIGSNASGNGSPVLQVKSFAQNQFDDSYMANISAGHIKLKAAADTEPELLFDNANGRIYFGNGFTDITTMPYLANVADRLALTQGYLSLGGNFDSKNLLMIGGYYLWIDSVGNLRYVFGKPTLETDGKVVGEPSTVKSLAADPTSPVLGQMWLRSDL